MGTTRHRPEEIVTKLRQVDVLVGHCEGVQCDPGMVPPPSSILSYKILFLFDIRIEKFKCTNKSEFQITRSHIFSSHPLITEVRTRRQFDSTSLY